MEFPVFMDECPQGVLQIEMEVTEDKVNLFDRIHLGELARQMQRLTETHLVKTAGISIDEITSAGKNWVICWTEMQILRLPKLGERLLIRIWPGKNKAVMYSRKYAFYTLSGEPLLTTASLFVLMDRTTRKMTEQLDTMNQIRAVSLAGEPKEPKMHMNFPKVYKNTISRAVTAKEIDYNGHLNNSHYLDWAEDLIDSSYLEKHESKAVWVQYTKELLEGQAVQLQFAWEDDTMYLRGSDDKNESFLIKIEY